MALKGGPLAGVRVVELAGIGPGPMCGMLLADMGAQVLLVERLEPANVGIARPRKYELPHRGKQSIAIDLKHTDGVALVADLAAAADVLIEGFRPGTMERLGLGPDACMARQPRLVYGRMTGYGQSGPMRHAAGHDLNYLALSGALSAIGRAGQKPNAPLNLLADYAGGAMNLAFGIACALVERDRSGLGQVIDASMVEGTALLMTSMFGMYAAGIHNAPRGHNILDGGAPYYDTYACSDGAYVAFAAIEHKFRAVFAERAGIAYEALTQLDDPLTWPEGRAMLTAVFASRTQREWCELLEDSDACVTPVLNREEAPGHRHNAARGSFVVSDGVAQPAVSPRLSRTPGANPAPPPERGERGDATAMSWGIPLARLERLRGARVLGPTS
ncbi:MAG: Alpha-methylacyl-CoA racemase [Ramlibacter sp.]|jgi:alpha-methylacyl-CoA racemase|nr:Alpha-methylacyl-CoA racemase [Ramlibacter sp.]